ncbi:MAG: hemerythrin domain-containing protein [Hyphomicrobiales bacterium]|nr:hemerythrin domain-containing protein [Hyphomicrobiales bacterium]
MSFANPVSQTLHEEHRATVALMERLEQLLARHRKGVPSTDAALRQLLADLATGVAAEVQRHFAFEEQHLFTFLEANGDEAIGAHLTEEHAAMRPLGVKLAELAGAAAAAQGFDEASWQEFRRLGQELCERMLAHVQKEEMALLPLLDECMDADTGARLLQDYLESA